MRTGSALLGRTGLVGVGVVASGVGTLAMLAISAHGSSVTSYATVATWWILATLVAYPFGVFEAYLTRLVVAARAAGRSPTAAISTMAGRAGVLALAVAVIGTLLDPVLADEVFQGVTGLGPLLGVFCLVGAAQAILRGYAAGAGRFGVVSVQMTCDGVGRAVLVAVVVLVRPDDVRAQVAAICVGAALSVPIAAVACAEFWTWPRLRNRAIGQREVIALLVGALGPILINNVSVPWLSQAGASVLLIGAFSGALTLSRVPTQLAGAAFGPLLNEISHLVEVGDHTMLRRVTLRATAVAVALAAVFVAGFTLLGPWVLGVFIGEQYVLPTWVFFLLGAATGAMLVAVVVQARVAAEQRWFALAASWLLAAVVFVAVLALPIPILERAAWSPLAAALVALAALVWASRGAGRRETDGLSDGVSAPPARGRPPRAPRRSAAT